jgi:flagellar basal-body rod modification protein FlgD
MDATSIKSLSSPSAGTQAAQSGKNSELGKDQFLKLFVAQLQHQDPMNPMQDQDFMGQMASFSTLEQVTNLASANEAIASNLSLSHSVGLLGRTVSWTDEAEVLHTGVVEKVNQSADGKPVLTVSGTAGVDPSTITQIA